MTLDPASLKTPIGHRETLVWPPPSIWTAQLRENAARIRDARLTLGGEPLADLRRNIRLRLTGHDDRPIVALGHQPEWIHPGIWSKHVVADRFARAVGGVAVNLIVDGDAMKSNALPLPRREDDRWSLRSLRFTAAPAATLYEHLPPAPPADIDRWESAWRETLGYAFPDSMLPLFLQGVRSCTAPRGLVDQLVAGRRAVDAAFGIHLIEHRITALPLTPLLLETCRNPLRFARAYNDALHQYRSARNLNDTRRPMPDLLITPQTIELPWWFVQPGHPRKRLFVKPQPNRIILLAESKSVFDESSAACSQADALHAALIRRHGQSFIRPRALTLTLWARLLLADFFLHGIGGARYDAVCDELIRRYFNLDPPHFAVVSATLHWDATTDAATPPAIAHGLRDLRDLRYNPQRFFHAQPERTGPFNARRAAIDESTRLARTQPRDHAARRAVFLRIRAANAAILEQNPAFAAELETRFTAALHDARRSAIARGRDYFFAAYSAAQLHALAAALPATHDFRL